MYLPIDELKTHLYDEELSAIIRNDETIAHACIDMAIEFATSKLMKHYNTTAIFSAEGNHRNALVLKIVKDIAAWELIGLSNPSIDYPDKKFRYEQAVDWLTAVYKGMPANLPRIEEKTIENSSFKYHSNPPRTNHY